MENATDCLVVSEGCLYIVGIYICFVSKTSVQISALNDLADFFCPLWCTCLVMSCPVPSYMVIFCCLLLKFTAQLPTWQRLLSQGHFNLHFVPLIMVMNVTIAKISMTSPIVINMPTRELLAGETKNSFV